MVFRWFCYLACESWFLSVGRVVFFYLFICLYTCLFYQQLLLSDGFWFGCWVYGVLLVRLRGSVIWWFQSKDFWVEKCIRDRGLVVGRGMSFIVQQFVRFCLVGYFFVFFVDFLRQQVYGQSFRLVFFYFRILFLGVFSQVGGQSVFVKLGRI